MSKFVEIRQTSDGARGMQKAQLSAFWNIFQLRHFSYFYICWSFSNKVLLSPYWSFSPGHTLKFRIEYTARKSFSKCTVTGTIFMIRFTPRRLYHVSDFLVTDLCELTLPRSLTTFTLTCCYLLCRQITKYFSRPTNLRRNFRTRCDVCIA